MNYFILVNKDKPLPKTYIPSDLINVDSKYKKNILLDKNAYNSFKLLQSEAKQNGFEIDIESGYRSYYYQEKLYKKILDEKGFSYVYTRVSEPGKSEHQTGLAIDICIYRNNNCYIEENIDDLDEIKWLKNNMYKYGFILRYLPDKENITKYSYKSWHIRYIKDISKAKFILDNNLTFEEYISEYT